MRAYCPDGLPGRVTPQLCAVSLGELFLITAISMGCAMPDFSAVAQVGDLEAEPPVDWPQIGLSPHARLGG